MGSLRLDFGFTDRKRGKGFLIGRLDISSFVFDWFVPRIVIVRKDLVVTAYYYVLSLVGCSLIERE